MPRLSIVIPAYNEETRIQETLDHVHRYCAGQNYASEILVVNDGSTDRTSELTEAALRQGHDRLINLSSNKGKGYAVRSGVLAAQGQYILFMDADLSTPLEELPKLFQAIEGGADIAIASREAHGASITAKWYRVIIGRCFNRLARWLVFRDIQDSQCGCKLFKRDAAQQIFSYQQLHGFCFDAEVLFIAQRLGFRISEVGVKWVHMPRTKVKLWRDAPRMFIDLLRIRWMYRREKILPRETHWQG